MTEAFTEKTNSISASGASTIGFCSYPRSQPRRLQVLVQAQFTAAERPYMRVMGELRVLHGSSVDRDAVMKVFLPCALYIPSVL